MKPEIVIKVFTPEVRVIIKRYEESWRRYACIRTTVYNAMLDGFRHAGCMYDVMSPFRQHVLGECNGGPGGRFVRKPYISLQNSKWTVAEQTGGWDI